MRLISKCHPEWLRPQARKLLGVGYAMPQMKATVVRADSVEPSCSQAALWPISLILVFFALLRFEVIHHLGKEWSLNPQYSYGWSVPFLTFYLIWRRWSGRPSPAPPKSRLWAEAVIISCALFVLPIRFVGEANPDWRVLGWAFALIAVTISLSVVFLEGGRPWFCYFAFPFLFFLVAVPWPTHLEQMVVQDLMRAVTAVNVLVLNIAGVPALAHGNVIEVGSGLIGVEEANRKVDDMGKNFDSELSYDPLAFF